MGQNLPCLCNDSINYLRSIHVDQLDSIQYDEYHTTIPNGTLNFVRQTEPTPFYLIGVENQLDLYLLNLQLNKFGYPSLNRLLNTDSLELKCNSWYGNINILSSESKQLIWILELKNKYLYIYKSEDYYRDPNDPIKTKLVMMLNLGNEDAKIFGEKESIFIKELK